MKTAFYASPLGQLLMAVQGTALTGLWMEGQKYYPEQTLLQEPDEQEAKTLEKVRLWLDRYFRGEKPSPSELVLAPEGTAFRQEVWALLCEIPYGETLSYRDLARTLDARHPGHKTSARAVGGAVGRNPISIAIPCHRVLGADGSLTGYAGGLDRKRWLLKLEQDTL